MNKSTINIIILLMSIALFGISVIQFYWLKKGIDLNANNFDGKVELALSLVKQEIEKDAANLADIADDMNFTLSDKFKNPTNSSLNSRRQQVADLFKKFNPDQALNNINPADLSRYLRLKLKEQDIDLDYDFGVHSRKTGGLIIYNGKYIVSLGDNSQASAGEVINKNLEKNAYEEDLFYNLQETEAAGSLHIFFPRKASFLISSVLPALLSSVLLTGLILFCFVYTINVILTQKKVSLMKTDFINNMTHEFKTPIATISLAADSINNPKVMDKPHLITRYANIIKEENGRMLDQVEKVLNIARLDKEDFQLKVVPLDINQLVTTVVEMTELKIHDRGGTIVKRLEATTPDIQGDENHISNLLHNLLDNANKYSPEKPEIKVVTENTKEGVNIIISDKGMGMTKEDSKRIFEKFYRVSTGNLHDIKGFGLGLSYVKAIVDAHKGSVKVDSQLNEGSIFTVFFPFDFNGIK